MPPLKKSKNFNLIHVLPWARNYYNRYMPIITLLIKTYPEGLKSIGFKLKNFFEKIDLPPLRKKSQKIDFLGKISKF